MLSSQVVYFNSTINKINFNAPSIQNYVVDKRK